MTDLPLSDLALIILSVIGLALLGWLVWVAFDAGDWARKEGKYKEREK